VPAHGKPAAGEAVDARDTACQIKDAAALIAMEVVMMRFPGTLVDGGGAWKIDGRKPAFFEQCLDIPINGGDPEAFHFGLRRPERLLWRKRPAGMFERFTDCGALPGVPMIFPSIRSA
jgi:hypothetical protein